MHCGHADGVKQIQRDLFEVTEALCATAARALGARSGAAPKLVWTDGRSRLAAMVAHVHGIGPLLDSFEWDAPDPLRAELRQQAAGSRARAVRLLAVRDSIVAALRESGVEPIALKGAAFAETLYAAPGLRPMADLDFLIAETDAEACDRAALSAGLTRSSASDRHIVYALEPTRIVALLREDPDNPIKLEVHRRLAEAFWGVPYDITGAFRRADRPVGHCLHGLLHCSHHASVRTLRFCQVADLALLLANLVPRDLASLVAALRACGGLGWAYAPLKLVEGYFPGVVDAGMVAETARAAPALARHARRWTISELSFCALGDGGIAIRLRWAPTLLAAARGLLRHALDQGGARSELAAEFQSGRYGRATRGLAWLLGRGVRPVSARLVELALAAPPAEAGAP